MSHFPVSPNTQFFFFLFFQCVLLQPTNIPLLLPEDVGDVRVQTEDPDHQRRRDQYE